MSDLKTRIPMLREMRRNHLARLRANCKSPGADETGSATNSVIGTLRFLAVADFVIDGDIRAFGLQLSEAAELRKQLLERFDLGEPISPSYASILAYRAILNALAAGDVVLAMSIAALVGGRKEVESEYDRPFDLALGYALKHMVEKDDLAAKSYTNSLEAECRRAENADFAGYVSVIRAILDADVEACNEGFAELVAGHERQSRGKGLFKDTEDELLCVWGIGLANLAHMRGIPTRSPSPLVPSALLIAVQAAQH